MTINKMVWGSGAVMSAAGAVVASMLFGEDRPTPRLLVHNSGYAQVVPPGDHFGPGTINTVERLEDGSLQLFPTCNIAKEDLVARLQVSPTLEQSFTSMVEGKFNAEVGAAGLPSTAVGGGIGQAVQLQLKDVSQVLMSQESLFEIQGKYLQGTCERAIEMNLKAGAQVCQTVAVLRGDLVYRVSEKRDLSAEQKAEIKETLKEKLSIGGTAGHVEEVLGDDLYFGVRMMHECFVLPSQETGTEQARARPPEVS